MYFYGSKIAVARFVTDCLVSLNINSASITITSRDKYEGCSVRIVTDTSLAGIVEGRAMRYSLQRINTSPRNTPAGRSPRK